MLRKFNLYFRMFQCFTITKNCHQLDFIPCLHPVITMVLSLLTESAQQFIYYYYFFKYHLLINLRKEKKKLHTLETPHTRHPQSCCHDVESCDHCPHRRPPLSHPGYEGSSAHCWVESVNCVPDPSPPSVWAETHWTSAVVAALLHLCADCLISYWNNTLFLFYQMVKIKAWDFTHSLFLQVISHLLVFMLCQLLITILIVFGKDGLNLCICVTLSDEIKRQYTLKTGCMSVIFNKLSTTTLRDFSRIRVSSPF